MKRSFKRGYAEPGYNGDFVAVVTRVKQSDDFGKWEDEDEDEIDRYSGYNTLAEAIKDLQEFFKVKEILNKDYETIWRII